MSITGRYPNKGPNMQGIPIRTEEGRKIREAFLSADEVFGAEADRRRAYAESAEGLAALERSLAKGRREEDARMTYEASPEGAYHRGYVAGENGEEFCVPEGEAYPKDWSQGYYVGQSDAQERSGFDGDIEYEGNE